MIRAFLLLVSFSVLFAGGEVPPQLDPYNPQYKPGVVLVKFKDAVQLDHNALARATNPVLGISSVDLLNLEFEVQNVQKVFSQQEQRILAKIVQMPQGMIEAPNLHNIYKLVFSGNASVETMVQAFSEDPNVEYAEPDYLFRVMETIPDDPMYSQQWHHAAVNAPALWDSTTGDTSQIIGIIDTGVDWDHPDLAENIWINWTEYNGAPGVDDDGNGYVDDIRGWDWISDDNDPNDDNSHGTHVAGIAAAVGNNGIGVTGVSWNSKIMCLKVLQSTGYGTSSDVAAAVEYAGNNGATVMNLSLGSYGHSQVLENALAVAYNTTIEVAAAGNSGLCIGPGLCPDRRLGAPMYPGAFSWVLGVQAGDAMGSNGFSNYDQDGPQGSVYLDGYNYELRAPGSGINSTFPNGGYHSLNGTSMASPVVAGGVANILAYEEHISTELFRAKLINNTGTHVDLYETLISPDPDPLLSYVSHTIVDTCDVCDNDGRADAGEIIEVWFTVKNYGGYADSVTVSINFAEFEDTNVAQIVNNEVCIEGISSYGQATNKTEPLIIQFGESIANGRVISFTSSFNIVGGEGDSYDVNLAIERGTELTGVMDTTLTLNADKLWLVNSSFKVGENGILIINPGTHVILNEKMSNLGQIIGLGASTNPIHFWGPNAIDGGTVNMNYTIFQGMEYSFKNLDGEFRYCIFKEFNIPQGEYYLFDSYGSISFSDCQFIDGFAQASLVGGSSHIFTRCVFSNYNSYMYGSLKGLNLQFSYCNFSNVSTELDLFYNSSINTTNIFEYNNILTRSEIPLYGSSPGTIDSIAPQYWGSIDDDIISEYCIYDFYDDASLAEVLLTDKLLVPSYISHGITWKILINDVEAQGDELEYLDVGTYVFDVYFNRAMDVDYEPFLTFGVDQPYTQHVVNDSSSWSADSTIWTAYYTMGIETGDGINRVRVSGARDDENFEIPIEDKRFEFVLQAAGAASVAFMATPGIGKVDLEWPPASTDDALGYNMYRSLKLNDSTWAEYEMVNDILITDSTYIDFVVIPDSTYRYQYTVLGTDFAESDPSKTVPATPFSAANGDANGDLSVNVLDIISMVSYVLEGDPTPFLFDAADLNSDDQVNVLDIIGVINIILGNTAKIAGQPGEAIAALENNEFWISSQNAIGGLQLKLSGDLENARITSPYAMELTSSINADGEMTVLLYSMSGEVLPLGNHAIIRIEGAGRISISEMIVSDPRGQVMLSRIGDPNEVKLPDTFILKQNYPNPFNGFTTIEYALPVASDVTLIVYNLLGQEVYQMSTHAQAAGWYSHTWNGTNRSGKNMASGIYLYRFQAGEFSQVHKMLLLK
jgi:subtilisin family serine protease